MRTTERKTPAKSTMPSVFAFSDFREYLKSYAEARRSGNRKWSYGMWARHLGLSGTASLTMVLNGQRLPGASSRHR